MGIPLVIAAIILGIAAYRDSIGYLGQNLGQDFKGFLKWGAAIGAIGALGSIPKARVPAQALLFLVFLVLFVSNKGIFINIQNFTGSIKSPPTPPSSTPVQEGKVSGSTSTVTTPQVTNPDANLVPGGALQGTGTTGLGTAIAPAAIIPQFDNVVKLFAQ